MSTGAIPCHAIPYPLELPADFARVGASSVRRWTTATGEPAVLMSADITCTVPAVGSSRSSGAGPSKVVADAAGTLPW